MRRRWLMVGLLLLAAAALGACGVDLSGEPEIRDEVEIRSTATPRPSPTPDATQVAEMAATEAAAPDDTASDDDASAAAGDSAAQPPDRTMGRELFLANCVTCHASEDGTGPGLFTIIAEAETRVEGMTETEYLTESIIDPGAFIVEGYENIMPAGYGDQFTEYEIASMVAFIAEAEGRPDSAAAQEDTAPELDTGALPGAEPTHVPIEDQEEVLTVQGSVVQGTEDGEAIPAGLPLDLIALVVVDDTEVPIAEYQTETTEGGAFVFENVARAPGNIYLIRATYADVPQGVQISEIAGTEDVITQNVTVYERTTDATQVHVQYAQMLINFGTVSGPGLEVWLTLELLNTGDRIVTTDEVAETGWLVTVPVELPVGAVGIQPMQVEGSRRYQVELVDNIPVMKDTWPLRPNQPHTVAVAYYLPYGSGAVIDQHFGYTVLDGVVLVPNDTVEFTSDQFDEDGDFSYRVAEGGFHLTPLQPDEAIDPDDPTLVRAYSLEAAVDADDRIIFTLNGQPTRTLNTISSSPSSATTTSSSSDDDVDLLPVALFVLGISILALAAVLWWRERRTVAVPGSEAAPRRDAGIGDWQPPAKSAGKDELMAAIVELDDRYANRAIDEDTYQEERGILIERLMPYLDDGDNAP